MGEKQAHVIRVGSMQVQRRKICTRNGGTIKATAMEGGVSFSERLLRDCALCTAALLCVMGMNNATHPVASMTAQRLSQVATTDIETEEILGQLQFVQNLFPESVQVFWTDSDSKTMIHAPSQGDIRHVWAIAEPWTEYAGAQMVQACGDGEVMSVTPWGDGTFSVRIRHSDALESMYSQLTECVVSEGEWLDQGSALGYVEEGLLFEMRKDGRDIDPQSLM